MSTETITVLLDPMPVTIGGVAEAVTLTVQLGTPGPPGEPGDPGAGVGDWQGDWVAGTYVVNDVVRNDGKTWIVTAVSTTEEPTGTPTDWDVLNEDGTDGAAATIAVGTVDSVPFGDPATIVNSGTSSAAVFDFEIPAGQPGTNGTDGTDGKTVRNGTGAPGDGLGVDGDFYIDLTSDAIWGPKAAGSWSGTGPTSLVGPAGTAGGFDSTMTIVDDSNTGASAYTVTQADAGKLRRMTGGSAITVVIPTDATEDITVGTVFYFVQSGAGQVTVAAATPGTTTVNAAPTAKTRAQHSGLMVVKTGDDRWLVVGDLAAS